MDRNNRQPRTIALVLSLLALSTSTFAMAKKQLPVGSVLNLRNTFYYVVPESLYPLSPQDIPVLAKDGSVLTKVHAKFKKAMDIEGTGKLENGQVLNYIARGADGSIRYAFTRHPFGRAVGDCPLYPYHSAAVDPAVVPLGTVLEIARTKGMLLPDGSISNGLWRAEDIGGAIKGDRIDLFVGTDIKGEYLKRANIGHLESLAAKVVSTPPSPNCVDQDPS